MPINQTFKIKSFDFGFSLIIITVLSYIGWPVLNNNDVGMKLRLD